MITEERTLSEKCCVQHDRVLEILLESFYSHPGSTFSSIWFFMCRN